MGCPLDQLMGNLVCSQGLACAALGDQFLGHAEYDCAFLGFGDGASSAFVDFGEGVSPIIPHARKHDGDQVAGLANVQHRAPQALDGRVPEVLG